MILIGELALWVALLMAAWSAITSFAGGKLRRADLIMSGERGIHATWILIVAASLGLWTALLTHDFSFRYVAANTSANLPSIYTFTSFWSGQAGSLLFCALLLSTCSVICQYANRDSNRELMPYVSGTLATVTLIFLAAMCFRANPYERLDWIPADGRGMNPQLQHPGMAIHPASLYLGYVATTIPLAFGVAALIARRLDERWLAPVRRWSLVSWFLLTVGITLGMWWAYVEPGWSGHWAWYPVKSSSLLTWLTATALLLSFMVQEKHGMPRKWNVTLVVSSFLLAMLGTVITRNGILTSAHSFVQSGIGSWFATFVLVAIVITVWLVATRLEDPQPKAELESVISRRYGRYVVLVGILMLLVGFAGQAYSTVHDVRLRPGETFTQRDPYGHEWTFTSQGVSRFDKVNRSVVAVALQMTREGKPMGIISSEKQQHVDTRGIAAFEPSTQVGIRTTLRGDTYVVLAGVSEDETVELRISFNPLVMLVWIGGGIMAIGGLIVMWPAAERQRRQSGYAAGLPSARREPEPALP